MISDQQRRRTYARQNNRTGLTSRQGRRVLKKFAHNRSRSPLCSCWILAFDPITDKTALARWLAGGDAWKAAGVTERHVACEAEQ